ncbi:MAG TPA: GAF domain-containing protein [Longimicrobiaceae bacterium]|nr:GAF domain-containing protein [Longimicrobiaceae bacterium]
MSTVVKTRAAQDGPTDLGQLLRESVADGRDVDGVTQAAAEILSTELRRPVVSIYRCEAATGDLVLVGAAPASRSSAPKGSRLKTERSVVEAARRERQTQRSLNYYVEPDFVRSLPGETRSALAVPVLEGEAVLGVLHLEYAAPHTPSPADESASELLATHLSDAWTNGRTANGEAAGGTGRHDAAASLGALLGALAQSDDFEGSLTRIPAAAVHLLGCGGAALLRRHSIRNGLEVVAAAGSLDMPIDALVPIDGTEIGALFLKGVPAELSGHSAEGDQPIFPEAVLAIPPRDALVVPVSSAGKVTGLLVAADSAPGSGFAPDHVRLLQSLADHAGATDALRSIGPLRQKISDASLIAEVGRAMTGTLGLDEVLGLVVRSAEMLVSGRCAGVGLLSPDGSMLTLAAASGSLMTRTKAPISILDTVVGWVAANGENVITESLSDDERGWPFGENFGPAVLVPLESRGQILGVLFAARGSNGAPIGDDNVDAIRKLGAYSAIAIENARLYREQTELSATLKKQAHELEKAYAELRASQERLLVSEKMAALGRVTAGIAHEINSPLGSILNCLQLATTYAEEYRNSADDSEVTAEDHLGIAKDLLETLHLAEEATRRVGEFVRTIKGQTRMEEEHFEIFEPADTTEGTILMLQHEIQAGPVTIEPQLDASVQVRGDTNKFAVIVQNLITNAVHAYEGKPGVVHVRLRQEGADAILEVEDAGTGIPEEIRPRIYDYLFTTKDIGAGTGLGLSLVHSIVTSHFDGKVDFRTETGVGTTFVVTIPLAAADENG